MEWFAAADTFVAVLDNGAEELVAKGKTYPGSHELVRRDQAAQERDSGRSPLFRPLDFGDEETPRRAVAAAAPVVKPEPKAGRPAGRPGGKGA